MLKSNFGNGEKLVPTRKPIRMFGLNFEMQGLTSKQRPLFPGPEGGRYTQV